MGLEELVRLSDNELVVQLPKTLTADIEDEVKIAFEALKVEIRAEKLDDITPVIEQELDPETYSSSEYSFEMQYGGQTVKGNYDTYEAKEGENEASYSIEHQHLEEAQKEADAAREANITNKTNVEKYLDEGIKAAITEQYIISVARWQTMYNGKIHFN